MLTEKFPYLASMSGRGRKDIKRRGMTGLENQDLDPYPPRQRGLVVWLQTVALSLGFRWYELSEVRIALFCRISSAISSVLRRMSSAWPTVLRRISSAWPSVLRRMNYAISTVPRSDKLCVTNSASQDKLSKIKCASQDELCDINCASQRGAAITSELRSLGSVMTKSCSLKSALPKSSLTENEPCFLKKCAPQGLHHNPLATCRHLSVVLGTSI
jgi:hypothetical protein